MKSQSVIMSNQVDRGSMPRRVNTEPANLNHKDVSVEKSPRNKKLKDQRNVFDLDMSADSCSVDSQNDRINKPKLKNTAGKTSSAEWEILEGLRDGQRCEEKPDRYEGYMMKRRKWPMKGWHKRYFVLENGTLIHAKTPSEIAKGKLHGSVDVGLSVISTKSHGRRIDIDAEVIYHLKVKSRESFLEWIARLRHHRLYRQHEIAFGSREAPKLSTPVEELSPGINLSLPLSLSTDPKSRNTSLNCDKRKSSFGIPSSANRVAAWVLDSAAVEQCNKELAAAQNSIFQLSTILEQLENTSNSSDHLFELPEIGPLNLKKDRKKISFRKLKRSDKKLDSSNYLAAKNSIHTLSVSTERLHLSSSNPNLLASDDGLRPSSLPDTTSHFLISQEQRINESKMREEFLSLAKEVLGNLRSLVRSIHTERDRLKQAFEQDTVSGNLSYIHTQRAALAQALQQNAELRARLNRIRAEADISDFLLTSPTRESLSNESASISEYFDAAENLASSESSSEGSISENELEEEDAESLSSENSDEGAEYTPVESVTENEAVHSILCNCRRSKLPVPKPDTGDVSLWNLLCKNIGKDLSKISMPVTLNEPLNMLQRLCEELEYSELLDKAAETDDHIERMVFIVAFAVSAYGATYFRAGHKPFNPLLGETYECIREDKGFRFIAEQVSHHPPISACYAESKNFIFWQDVRIKSKFWGKSMEILPMGTVHVTLPKYQDHYRWNKVTTCVHNLLSGQRWVDQYGEMIITGDSLVCRLTFIKANYWSGKRHEVYGSITDLNGKVIQSVFGKWNEGFYYGIPPSAKCIWRPGAMPEDHELYYGFTKFAIELNELDSDMTKLLPPTDTRLRPDQRLLEEGNVQASESQKVRLENIQRENRKKKEEQGLTHESLWFKKIIDDGKEAWVYQHTYWQKRKNPGFINMNFTKLW